MKKETIVIALMAVTIVFLGGFLILNLSSKKEEVAPAGGISAGSGSPVDYRQRISELEKIVAADPKNIQAWTMLGNDYYDTDQPQKAIEAYNRVLEVYPGNTNILTDQGVMFKRLGEYEMAHANADKAKGYFEKALANFEKAQQLDPKHMQSLYNMGIIYYEDLKQPDKALKAWNRFLEMDSTSPAAQQVKRMMNEMKMGSGK